MSTRTGWSSTFDQFSSVRPASGVPARGSLDPEGRQTEVILPRRPAHRNQNCVKNAQDSVAIQFVLLPESLAMFVCPPLKVHALVGYSALQPWKS